MTMSIMQYGEVFIIHTAAKIIKCNLSNKGYRAVHSCGAVCLFVQLDLVRRIINFPIQESDVRIFVLFYSTAKLGNTPLPSRFRP